MDMSTSTDMSMSMAMSTATSMAMSATASAAAATTSAMSMSMSDDCKVSMLWNWYTIDSCFIAESWHVTSNGMFAGSCIGVILLVMLLELLRRSVKEYDRYLVHKHSASAGAAAGPSIKSSGSGSPTPMPVVPRTTSAGFRPTIFEQAVRALLHMLQFAVAYFVMLLAMYYNGYIIICIFIGAYLGSFVFQWEIMGGGNSPTSAAEEATVCCG